MALVKVRRTSGNNRGVVRMQARLAAVLVQAGRLEYVDDEPKVAVPPPVPPPPQPEPERKTKAKNKAMRAEEPNDGAAMEPPQQGKGGAAQEGTATGEEDQEENKAPEEVGAKGKYRRRDMQADNE